MTFLDDIFGVELPGALEHPLYEALCGNDEAWAVRHLQELQQPLTRQAAGCCLRKALECSPELFLQVLEHCEPGEHVERYFICTDSDSGRVRTYITSCGSLLLLAAMADKPVHARLLLEHGYDCNGAGLELANNMAESFGMGTVPPYGRFGGVHGNMLHVSGLQCHLGIRCATPLAGALLCGSLRTAEVLLRWPGVWKSESSAVCRAAVMVLEGITDQILSEERRQAHPEILRQIFCPEREVLPDKETLLRTCYLQPSSFVDLCGTRTLRCQLESGLCGEEDARQLLELIEYRSQWPDKIYNRTTGGKLLLLKQYFPEVCRQPWATGVFLREILRRCKAKKPYQTLIKAWKQLCGKERDLSWMNDTFWGIGLRDLRRFLKEAEEGGALVMDADAVNAWSISRQSTMMEFVKRVQFRWRTEAGISGLMQRLMEMGDIRLLRCAAKQGLLEGEEPGVLMKYLIEENRINTDIRAIVLTSAGKRAAEENRLAECWQDPQRWRYWCEWNNDDISPEELHDVLYRELPREECLRKMFHLRQALGQDFLNPDISVENPRYPTLKTDSLAGIACCAEQSQPMQILLEHLPRQMREMVRANWGDWLYFQGTHLCLSAALGRTGQVRLLLEAGMHPDEIGRGDISRFFARQKNFKEDFVAVTPLLAAILFAQEETARLLLEYGAVCDFSRPDCRRILWRGSAATLALAERLPGVGFGQIPAEELEALRINVAEGGTQACLWRWLEGEKSLSDEETG